MAKTYDPKADYEVVKGPVSIKEKGTNLRKILTTGEITKLTHLEPHQIAFLVEKKGVYKLATAGSGGKS